MIGQYLYCSAVQFLYYSAVEHIRIILWWNCTSIVKEMIAFIGQMDSCHYQEDQQKYNSVIKMKMAAMQNKMLMLMKTIDGSHWSTLMSANQFIIRWNGSEKPIWLQNFWIFQPVLIWPRSRARQYLEWNELKKSVAEKVEKKNFRFFFLSFIVQIR